jgi:hypothetical protein
MNEKRMEGTKKKRMPQSREIIIKFREGGPLEAKGGRISAEHISLDRFYHTLESISGAQARLSFDMKKDRLNELRMRAVRSLRKPIPSLDSFVRVRLPEEADVERIVERFADDPEVEYSCVAGIPGPPPQTPNYTGQQVYEDPAPDGVDAEYAWLHPGGDGAGVQICDCEYGFNANHEDLPGVAVVSNHDGSLTSWEDHGTAVLGELAAQADTLGVTGISSGATLMFASESGGHRLDCIQDAILALNAGDVLVLEMQTGPGAYRPAESDPDIHAAITTAVGSGVVVVAAAGNGGIDLATADDANGNFIWSPSSPDYDDSGTIIVGAGASTLNTHPHSRLSFSDYGTRVNCQGWGEDVVTTGEGDLYDGGANAEYTDTFGGTSSATPIVAGVVACLQGAAIQAFGAPLPPATIRNLLADPANGTPQADSPAFPAASYHIGPLPDLRRILRAASIQPDVFMRDNVADTGTEPYMGGTLCFSPDIIVRKSAVANPSVAFGPATWGDPNLCEKIELGQDNYVYVRMHNRGNVPDDVTVDVFWTDAAGFLHPSVWNPLGTLAITNIVAGEYQVEGPITWPASAVPPIGHYCLIAVVNSVRDPISVPGAFASVNDYLDFVRNHNNICYRNCDVEDAIAGAPVPPYKFLLRGLHEKAGRFRLEVRHRLPRNAKIEVEVGKAIDRFEKYVKIKEGPRQVFRLAPNTVFKLGDNRPLVVNDVFLKRRDAVPVEIRTEIPKETPPGEYMIHADQYYGNRHLGRVNYLLRIHKPKK